MIKKCNLIKGDWEPLVTEEVWWLARKIQDGRAAEYIYSKRGNIVNGLRESVDMIANKSFCQCGYSRSPQYLHVAKDGKEAQFRYTCRWQINSKTPEYRATHKLQPIPNLCTLGAVSEMKLWLMSLKVFEYVFGDRKEDILTTLKYIEEYKRQTAGSDNGKTLKDLEDELEKVINQIDKLYLEKLSGEIDANMYKRLSQTLTEKQKVLERGIQYRQQQEARDTRQLLEIIYIMRKVYMHYIYKNNIKNRFSDININVFSIEEYLKKSIKNNVVKEDNVLLKMKIFWSLINKGEEYGNKNV